MLGSLAAAGFSLLAALKVIGNEISVAFRVGSGDSLFGASLSLALIGVGHLAGAWAIGLGVVLYVVTILGLYRATQPLGRGPYGLRAGPTISR